MRIINSNKVEFDTNNGLRATLALISACVLSLAAHGALAVDGERGLRSTGSLNIGLLIPADKGLHAVQPTTELAAEDSLKSSSPFCIFGVDQKGVELKATSASGESISVDYLRPDVAENGDCTSKSRGMLAFAAESTADLGSVVTVTIGAI